MQRHSFIHIAFAILLGLATTPGCGDDTGGAPALDTGISETGSGTPALDGSADAAGGGISEAGQGGAALDGSVDSGGAGIPTGIVVVNSDYHSSSVSVLDHDGNLLLDGCLNSGTGNPGLAMTLSGDVVLPTQIPQGGPVAVIDRLNAAITWLDPATCAPLRQLAVGTGFASNPHDVVTLSATKAYVTRADENGKPSAAPGDFDEGNDVLIIDPSQAKILGRIDLKPYAPAGTTLLPRADRALMAGGMVYVSLNITDYASYGAGRLVMIDPASDTVVGTIDLPTVKNCGAMAYVASANRLFVACNGAYGDPAGQAAGSAIVAIDLAGSPNTQFAAATTVGLPFSNIALAVLDGNTALGVSVGDFSGTPPDSLWSLSFGGSAPLKIFDSSAGFAIGAVLVDAENHRVLAADGTTTSPAYLRIFDYTSGAFTPAGTIKTNPAQKLPPRALAFY